MKVGNKGDRIDARKLSELLRANLLRAVFHDYYQQLDTLRVLHQQAKKELLAEGRKHQAMKLLRQIPSIGPIRSVLLVAILQTPHRLDSFLAVVHRFFRRSGTRVSIQ